MNQEIFVFDIETIPDTDAAAALTGFSAAGDPIADRDAARQALIDYHLNITDGKNPFLRQPFHRVVAISFVRAAIGYDDMGQEFYLFKEVRSAGQLNWTEEQLVDGFFKLIENHQPRLVSFNGRTFDLPVLRYRAMKYGIAAPKFYTAGTKWESYGARGAYDWHCDLLDLLSDMGASARLKLSEVCALLGLPGKLGVDGSQVMTMADNGQLEDIRAYCETDVINTYLVYLHTMHHRGRISRLNFDKALDEIRKFLIKSEESHLQEFLNNWKS